MSSGSRAPGGINLDDLDIVPVGLEHVSALRYLHATAFRVNAAAVYADHELAAFEALVRSPDYAERLLRDRLLGAFHSGTLLGSVAWRAGSEADGAARIGSAFVAPMFMRLGLGRRLVSVAEDEVRRAGYGSAGVRATLNTVGFFEALGYRVTSHGIRQLAPKQALSVVFLRKAL